MHKHYSDTARAILKYTGAIYHNHLLKGVNKGAITEAEATKRFEAWYSEKQSKIDAKRNSISSADSDKANADRVAAEKKISSTSVLLSLLLLKLRWLLKLKMAAEAADLLLMKLHQVDEAPTAEEAPATKEVPTAEEAVLPAAEEAPTAEEATCC